MNLNLFFKTAYERHRIYVLKKHGCPKPWTEDKIFQNYRFCCTFRHLDKTSQWINHKLIHPNYANPNLWRIIIIARFISRISTLKKVKVILENYHDFVDALKEIYNELRRMQAAGEPIFTTAFIVNSGLGGGQYVDKVSYLFILLKIMIRTYPNFDEELISTASLQSIYHKLMEFAGISEFMSYQYLCDFKYSNRYLNNTEDDNTWVVLGIGAKRGLRRLLYNNHKGGLINLNDCIYILQEWKKHVEKTIEDEYTNTYCDLMGYCKNEFNIIDEYKPFTDLKLHNVEHWLCEYDKYCRGGSKKRKYNGGG